MPIPSKIFISASIFFLSSACLPLLSGCKNEFPENEFIGDRSYTLLDQDSLKVTFPDDFEGKIMVMGFIFTNCPDICPMTIHNLQLIQEKLKEEEIENVSFVALSFDPLRDRPYILKDYEKGREIDSQNFRFLTGNKSDIDTLLFDLHVIAIPGDTTSADDGSALYFFTHTDRISLIDQKMRLRKQYTGSRISIEEIVSDIKSLGD